MTQETNYKYRARVQETLGERTDEYMVTQVASNRQQLYYLLNKANLRVLSARSLGRTRERFDQ